MVTPRREAFGRAEPGDVDVLVPADACLALDVKSDPLGEVTETVAEPAVDRVFEVRVRIDEAGHDHGLVVVQSLAEIVRSWPTAVRWPSSKETAPRSIGGPSIGRTQSADITRFTAR